jgi:hypothetical protein
MNSVNPGQLSASHTVEAKPLECASLLAPLQLYRSARQRRQQGDCLKTYVWDGLSALFLRSLQSWDFAPGWYGIAPLALKLLRNQSIKGPKAQSISAWGEAPGLNRNNESRAESPSHASFETVSKLPRSMAPYGRASRLLASLALSYAKIR